MIIMQKEKAGSIILRGIVNIVIFVLNIVSRFIGRSRSWQI